jgi:hypothetical protein
VFWTASASRVPSGSRAPAVLITAAAIKVATSTMAATNPVAFRSRPGCRKDGEHEPSSTISANICGNFGKQLGFDIPPAVLLQADKVIQ